MYQSLVADWRSDDQRMQSLAVTRSGHLGYRVRRSTIVRPQSHP